MWDTYFFNLIVSSIGEDEKKMSLPPSSVSVRQNISLLRFIAFLLLGVFIATQSSKTGEEIKERHRANADLIARGQLTLDLFPPLSYYLATTAPQPILRLVEITARSISMSAMLHSQMRNGYASPQSHCWALWVALVIPCTLLSLQREQEPPHPLRSSAALGSCILVLSAVNLRGERHARISWLRQFLAVLAGMFGCNAADWITCYTSILAQNISSLSSRRVCPSGRLVAWRILFAASRTVLLALLMLTTAYGLLLPFSEVAAGGNHNLRFLDGPLRRALSPQPPLSLDSLGLAQHAKNIPRHAIVPFLPVSLYVPKAGFLWGGAEHGTTTSSSSHVRDDADHGLPMAAYFADPLARRYPWALEQPDAPGDEGLDDQQRAFVQSHLWPKALVYLRSRIDQRYLGTAVSLDDDDGDDERDRPAGDGPEEPFQRLPLGLRAEKSAATVWVLDYDPSEDAGFRLYNPHRNCHLATTFQSNSIDQVNVDYNDSIQVEMTRTIEASCTRLASKPASTFWIIEGSISRNEDPEPTWKLGISPVQGAVTTLRRGWDILRAHVSLYRWQNRHGEQLQLSPSPLAFTNVQQTVQVWSERLVLVCFLSGYSSFLVVAQRTGRMRNLTADSNCAFAALACCIHVFVYTFLGIARPYGPDAVLILAFHGLSSLFRVLKSDAKLQAT